MSREFGLELWLFVGTDQEKQGLIAEMLWSILHWLRDKELAMEK